MKFLIRTYQEDIMSSSCVSRAVKTDADCGHLCPEIIYFYGRHIIDGSNNKYSSNIFLLPDMET